MTQQEKYTVPHNDNVFNASHIASENKGKLITGQFVWTYDNKLCIRVEKPGYYDFIPCTDEEISCCTNINFPVPLQDQINALKNEITELRKDIIELQRLNAWPLLK